MTRNTPPSVSPLPWTRPVLVTLATAEEAQGKIAPAPTEYGSFVGS